MPCEIGFNVFQLEQPAVARCRLRDDCATRSTALEICLGCTIDLREGRRWRQCCGPYRNIKGVAAEAVGSYGKSFAQGDTPICSCNDEAHSKNSDIRARNINSDREDDRHRHDQGAGGTWNHESGYRAKIHNANSGRAGGARPLDGGRYKDNAGCDKKPECGC